MISTEPTRPSRWSRFAAVLAVGSLYFMPVRAETFEMLKLTIRKRFPSVRQLSTQGLADWLADTNKPAPLLIDARSRVEFAVSHLQGARPLTAVSEVKAAIKANGQPIVVYCSVGYRSSALAEKLQKAGLTNVYNLEGSIFGWANEGRPVFRGTNTTAEVHPYSAKWGKLLDQRFHPQSQLR